MVCDTSSQAILIINKPLTNQATIESRSLVRNRSSIYPEDWESIWESAGCASEHSLSSGSAGGGVAGSAAGSGSQGSAVGAVTAQEDLAGFIFLVDGPEAIASDCGVPFLYVGQAAPPDPDAVYIHITAGAGAVRV